MSYLPLVSIIIPVYNGSNYLSQSIQSALDQTYDNIEIIVVNDGSVDAGKTRDVALGFGDSIKYIEKTNGGVASALNEGIANMQGDYFSWLSHDDVYYPHKIQTQVDYYLNNSSERSCILYSDFEMVDQDLNILNTSKLKPSDSTNFRYWLTTNSSLNGCTLLVPKQCFEKAGRFLENLKHTQDYNLWFKFAKFHRFILQKKILVQSRQHELQDSKVESLNSERNKELRNMRIRFLNDLTKDEIRHAEGVDLTLAYFRFLRKLKIIKLPYAEYYFLKYVLKNRSA